jgi:DNA-binding XRE family transcriptional regulator
MHRCRRGRGPSGQLELFPAIPAAPSRPPAPARARERKAEQPVGRRAGARVHLGLIRALGGDVAIVGERILLAGSLDTTPGNAEFLVSLFKLYDWELRDLVAPRPAPPLDAEGHPAGPCPACGATAFWRRRGHDHLHAPATWLECARCSPIPDAGGPCPVIEWRPLHHPAEIETASAPADHIDEAPTGRRIAPRRFGAQMHAARLALGWSQARMARELGITRSYVSTLERDRRQPGPGLRQRFLALCRARRSAERAESAG